MKKGYKEKTSVLLFLFGLALIVAALAMLVPNLLDYRKSNQTYETLQEQYVEVKQNDGMEAAAETEQEEASRWYQDVSVDLKRLREQNGDIIGWIRFDGESPISYPVLYSGDDEKYLRTDIYGNETIAGCIFMEGMNTPDFNDSHTILYGHNMKNQSMFGSLRKYKTGDYYKDHSFFTIYTEDMAYRYQIFSYRDVSETDSVYTVGFAPDDTFAEFVRQMLQKSYEDTGVEVTKEDKVLTLSTCSTTGNRFVVHAVRTAEHKLEQN